jgi:hypothetical protein
MDNKAQQIAAAIETAASLAIIGEISVQECGEQTKALWSQAKALNLHHEVDAILQAMALAEMA